MEIASESPLGAERAQHEMMKGLPPAPRNEAELHGWAAEQLDCRLPLTEEGAGAPLRYLAHAFLGDHFGDGAAMPPTAEAEPAEAVRDCVVWASRGSGKTFLGAAATALDLLYKPGIQVRILAGSVEQAQKMHAYLRGFFSRPLLEDQVAGRITERRLMLKNGSRAEVLAATQESVRGTRVQKIRCDEVELFDQALWDAAQLATRSRQCGSWYVHGAIECLSTMHLPHGMMAQLVKEAQGGRRRLFTWNVVHVLEQCPDERKCDGSAGAAGKKEGAVLAHLGCPLLSACGGTAKKGDGGGGHLPIDDAIAQQSRVGRAVWEAEMLCRRPNRTLCVFPEFDAAVHVMEEDPPADGVWLCGMDFGFRAPAAILWAVQHADGRIDIVDERVEPGVVTAEHARRIAHGRWPRPEWIGVDPAGKARNGQTAQSDVQVLWSAGLRVRSESHKVRAGLEAIAARLKPANGGPPRLRIHARCRRLIEAMQQYRYDDRRPHAEEPLKDGVHDHPVDALRYLLMNIGPGVRTSNYADGRRW